MTAAPRKHGDKTKLPQFVAPCLARLSRSVPVGDQWVHEIKFDGYRLQARIDCGRVRLLTRSGLDWTDRFGPLAAQFTGLAVTSALIDGEAIVEDEKGASSFVALVESLKSNTTQTIVFVAFDLLWLDGVPLMERPLGERKLMLKTLLDANKPERVRYSEHLTGDGGKLFREACKVGLEGIVSKRLDKPYRSGRHDDWHKTKCVQNDEFVVIGYLNSSAVKDSVGALTVGFFDGKKLVYAGRVGTGFGRDAAHAIWLRLQPLRIDSSPLPVPISAPQRRGVHWVSPQLVAQLDYRAMTADGLLRHASFKALREDLAAAKVKRPHLLRD